MTVIDTSVWLDVFLDNEERFSKAEKFFMKASGLIYEPRVFRVELAGALARRFDKSDVSNFIEEIMSKVVLIDNPDEIAYLIALKTGCRAIDAYFIATAKLTNSILITNDRIMAENAKKYGIEAYYLIDEFDKAIERISKH
uniref:PIN domain-containing protein n=1 Tax=Archaeoglobus fulgidus TaxID=2234 RepID=A0A7J3LZD6_ARCFL